MDIGTLLRLCLSRWRAIALVVVAGAGAAWLTVQAAEPTYERELRFAVRPKPDIPATDLVEATGTLATRESPLMQTVSSLVSSDAVRARVRRHAGLAPGSPPVKQTSALSPGSNIVVVTLRGHDEAVVQRVGASLAPVASETVAEAYELLRLQQVSNAAPSGPVSPKVGQTVAIGALLGLLAALAAVFGEGTLRSLGGGRGRETARAEDHPEEEDAAREPPGVSVVLPRGMSRERWPKSLQR